jgi:hypothetical protein
MGTHYSGRMVEMPFYARVSKPERIFSGFLTIIVRNANDGNEATDDFLTRYDDNFSNAQTRNIDNYAPFDASDPSTGNSNFSSALNADGNLLLVANGGSNDINSDLTTTAHQWTNFDTADATGITATGGAALRFQPQNEGASANEEGIKLVQSTQLGTTGLVASNHLWKTRSGKVYRFTVNCTAGSAIGGSEKFYLKVKFKDGTTYTGSAINASIFSSAANSSINFVIPSDTNLDELIFYLLDPVDKDAANTHFDVNDVSLHEIVNKDRTGFGQSIGDYDVLVYHVTGCCHLKAFVQPYLADGTASYYKTSDLSGYPNTDASTWAKYIDHPACQNFVKFTLISRHNNAYDNQTWESSPIYLETETTGTDDKSIHIFNRHATNNAAYWNYGMPESMMGDDYNQSMIDRDTYLLKDASSVTTLGDPPSQGIIRRREQVFSTSSASYVDNLGVDRGFGSMGKDMRSETGNVGTINDLGNNTFFAPVHGVDIYATHPFTITSYVPGTMTAQTHTTYGALVRANTHDTSFWQLVVNIKMLAFNSGAGINEDYDYEFFKNRININYQPSGETQNIIFSPTRHTT